MMSNPKRFSESYVQRLAGTAVPTGVAEVARGVDPYLRESHSIIDSIRRCTPGISKELPAVRDLWGRPSSFAAASVGRMTPSPPSTPGARSRHISTKRSCAWA